MWLARLWDALGHGPATARRTPTPAPRKTRLRLTVERLEDRTVPANFTAADVPELIAAIDAANQTPEADTIALVAGTTFTLTEVNNTTNGATGLPTIAAGEDLTIFGNGGIIERSTATETPAFRLFDVAAGASLALENLTLQGGYAFGQGVSAQGGGILNHGALSLNAVTVQNNIVLGGTALRFPGSTAAGGGIYSTGSLTLESSTIQNNRATGGSGSISCSPGAGCSATRGGDGLGGGVYSSGTAKLSNVALVSNSALGGAGGAGATSGTRRGGGAGGNGLGGGMYAAGGDVTMRDTRATDNRAKGGAGGSGRPRGSRGQAIGGGLYIEPDALVCLDIFTESHVKRNKASTSGRNIAGPYTVCP